MRRWVQVVVAVQFFLWTVGFSSFVNETMSAADYEDQAVNSSPVRLIQQKDQVIVDNGYSRVTLTTPDGTIVGVSYGGIDNLLDDDRNGHVYWDANWERPEQESVYSRLSGTTFSVIKQTDDQVELSFSCKSDARSSNTVPFDFDKRLASAGVFVMLRGVSGFYSYAIYERRKGSPDLDLYQTRITFKLNPSKFVYMAMADNRRRIMPTAQDRSTGKPLAFKEAVLLTNPSNPDLRGEVDDKYCYSAEYKDINVHGWISMKPAVGFWVITPSHEYESGGPLKQDLTSHVGPVSVAMFMSTHYAGLDMTASFRNGEPWKKVFGPVFVYLNSNPKDPMSLWDNAKRQLTYETRKWPYDFPMSKDFIRSGQRGTVSGQLQVHDKFLRGGVTIGAENAYVGLAAPGEAGSWQRETKGYQFWVQADQRGRFLIRNVIPGTYNLYAWVPGFIGDFVYNRIVSITSGGNVNLGRITFEAPRDGPTLWEIGIPDRTAAEFYIPDPDPVYNKYRFDEKFRQYGLWERYSELYPKQDLTYKIKSSTYQKDWFFAQVTRKGPNQTYLPTTWKIEFTLSNVPGAGIYKLRIAIAAATLAEVQVRINEPASQPHFTTGLIGRDNAIARHGSHGLYWLFNIGVPGEKLVKGSNTIYLTQSRSRGPFVGVMYDYIRLERPASKPLWDEDSSSVGQKYSFW